LRLRGIARSGVIVFDSSIIVES